MRHRTEFRERLRKARADLLRTVATTDEELAAVGADTSDPADAAATRVTTTTLAGLQAHERHELAEIDAALARVEAGVFGVCAECGVTMSLIRLRALPSARLCLDCQTRKEA